METPASLKASRLSRLAVALSLSTLGLIFAGGLVTSTHSGLAVPDWPLSYGRFMPPMTGGILFEHGHRIFASLVGFLALLTAVFFTLYERRRDLKILAWAAVGGVALQGLLGGLTVLYRLPKPVSIAHACMAQTFFCLTLALAWRSRGIVVDADCSKPYAKPSLPALSLILFAFSYLQLVLGAVLRHTGWGFPLHAANAAIIGILVFWIFGRGSSSQFVSKASGALLGTFLLQVALGLSSFICLSRPASPVFSVLVITGHVSAGAAFLGLSLLLLLASWPARSRGKTSEDSSKLSDYFALTKPGISFMSGMTALAGFILGSRGAPDLRLLVHTVLGTCLVSAGACALNMLLEIDVDAKMRRTENRPLPRGRLKSGEALLFGALLSAAGLVYLSVAVNALAALLAGVTLSVYLYLYTPLKKMTSFCTTVGAVAGALPPVMGWAAATGRLGAEAGALFAIVFFWQFPHFLSLAWIYREDYARAGLFMLPDMEPTGESTGAKVVLNSFALLAVSFLPLALGLTGKVYGVTALVLGAGLLSLGVLFFAERSIPRARRLFFASLLYVPALLATLVLNKTTGF